MAESKQYLIGSMPRTLETNIGIATFLQTEEFFGLGVDYDVRVPDLLTAVTRDEVHDAARRTLDPPSDGGHRGPVHGRPPMNHAAVRAVFFDVDFTLIYPGPTFQGEGYAVFCQRYGIDVDPARFADAVLAASSISGRRLTTTSTARDLRPLYAPHHRGAWVGPVKRLDACAEEIYAEWAACQHFFLYDDVAPVLRELATRGFKIG